MSATRHVFALTGGLGSGKSTVARIWRDAGLPVVDADQLAREVVQPGSLGQARVVAEFGEALLTADGALDRAALARIVFADPQARLTLNSLLHPLIGEVAEARFSELARDGHALIAYEIPLLFETGQAERFRPIVVVSASPQAQLERTKQRDGHPQQAVASRLAAQLPLAEKIARADYVIDNDGSPEQTARQALEVLAQVRASLPQLG